MKGKYIYGIIKSNGVRKGLDIAGIGGRGVFSLNWRDLAAVVSTAKLQSYKTLTKEESVRDLVFHQKVIEEVMKEAVILPAKFGTMAEKEDEVTEVIKKGYPLLKATLKKMEGKLEVDLVATWETLEVVKAVYQENKKIQKQQARVAKSPEGRGVQEKIVLGKMVAEELARRKDRYGKMIMNSLSKFAVDVCPHDLFEEEVVFNAAFLLERTKIKAFEKEVNKLDKKLAGRLNFRLVGPLPPYSFATILVRRFKKEEVEQAKKALGLNGNLSLPKVKKAYHQKAEKFHPDKGGNSLEFSAVDAAYKLLREFCQNGLLNVEIMKWGEH